MANQAHHRINPINNTRGGAVGVVIALLLIIALTGGGGFFAYNQYLKESPLKTKLASLKMKEEVIRFTHARISKALHHNMVMLDDILVMMDREMERLKRIGKKFPQQKEIVAPQIKTLKIARERLSTELKAVTGKIEKIYVSWLVNRTEGVGQIRKQKTVLTRQLADAIRGESVLIGRVRSNTQAAS